MSLQMPSRITGPNLTLRRLVADDAAEILDAVVESGSGLSRYESWAAAPYDLDAAEAYVRWWEAAWREQRAFYFAIDNDAGRLSGTCGIGDLDPTGARGAIGYWIRSTESGRGLATAAVEIIARAAFEEGGFTELSIVTSPSNAASRRVAHKSGAVHRPGFNGTVFDDGEQVVGVEYVLVAPEGSSAG
jgi:RimJ/RimL family protein N-acetyltransferase